jgi:hypothetical protein
LRHRFAQGAVTEVALGDAQEFGTGPAFGEFFEVSHRGDAVVEAAGDKNVCGVADWLAASRRGEVFERESVAGGVSSGAEFAAHHGSAGVFPNGFLGVHDGLDEGYETEITFEK